MTRWLSHITAAAFLFILLMKTAAMPLVCLDYAINQDFIARTLCENRAMPAMHCHGKCFMKKQLARTGESQETPGSRSNTKLSMPDYNDAASDWHFVNHSSCCPPVYAGYVSVLTDRTGNLLLRPPILSLSFS